MRTRRQSWVVKRGRLFTKLSKSVSTFAWKVGSRKPEARQLVEEHWTGKTLSAVSCCHGRLLAVVRKFLVMVSIVFACRGCNAPSNGKVKATQIIEE